MSKKSIIVLIHDRHKLLYCIQIQNVVLLICSPYFASIPLRTPIISICVHVELPDLNNSISRLRLANSEMSDMATAKISHEKC
jgi:hypothetical protein